MNKMLMRIENEKGVIYVDEDMLPVLEQHFREKIKAEMRTVPEGW